ncbi:hypothetical protein [Streptomyces sp. NPDC059819]|uniref:hypothetical protein n=1 Tax=Streptomyces sp. NPDC059819 TaxID=3346963 RepID=UPI003667F3E5
MIELPLHQLPSYLDWFPRSDAGQAALAEHVMTTSRGRLWADRADRPCTVAVSCGGHLLLSGDPGALRPSALAPLARHYVLAPSGFLPALSRGLDRVTSWERMVYVRQERPACRVHRAG